MPSTPSGIFVTRLPHLLTESVARDVSIGGEGRKGYRGR